MASEYRMELSLDRVNHKDATSIDLIVIGSHVETLKNDLNWTILEAVEISDSYIAHITYTKLGEYVDCDEFTCFCNIQEKVITY